MTFIYMARKCKRLFFDLRHIKQEWLFGGEKGQTDLLTFEVI